MSRRMAVLDLGLRGGALGRGFYTGGISSEFAPRGRPSMKIERPGGVAQSGRYQSEPSTAVGCLEIERINSRHAAGRAALSNNRLFCPRHPYGICYGKDLRILFRLPRAFHFPAAFPPHLGLGGGGPRSSRVGWV